MYNKQKATKHTQSAKWKGKEGTGHYIPTTIRESERHRLQSYYKGTDQIQRRGKGKEELVLTYRLGRIEGRGKREKARCCKTL